MPESVETTKKSSRPNYYQAHKKIIQERDHKRYEQNKELFKERAREYRQNKKAEVLEARRKYYEEHKPEIASRIKQYDEEYQIEIAARRKQYREEHKPEIAAYKREYRQRKKEEKEIWNDIIDILASGIPDELPNEQNSQSQLNTENIPKKRKPEAELEPVSNTAESKSVSKALGKVPAKKRNRTEQFLPDVISTGFSR